MSLPNNILKQVTDPVIFLSPDNVLTTPLEEQERGGVALSNSLEGITSYNWRMRYIGNELRLSREPYSDYSVILTVSGITEFSFSFTQNMSITISYVKDGVSKLYWFDSSVSNYVTTEFPGITSPKLSLDDKRDYSSNISDVLFFYLKDGNLCYRQQRDRFSIERIIAATEATKIRRIGMTTGIRFAVELNTIVPVTVEPDPDEEVPIIPVGPCDDDYDKVILLLNMYGENGSTIITDVKSNIVTNYNVTLKKPATYINADLLLSTSSFQQASASNYLLIDNNNINLSTDITFDMYLSLNSISADYTLLGSWDGGNGRSFIVYIEAKKLSIYISTTGSNYDMVGILTISEWAANTLNHLEISKTTGGIYRVFFNGVLKGTMTNTSIPKIPTIPFIIGGTPSGIYSPGMSDDAKGSYLKFRGYIEKFRITKAIRHTENFTVPDRDYPIISC